MNITAYDWHDLAKLFKPVYNESLGSCKWDKDTNQIDYHRIDGSEIQFPSQSDTLSKEILNSLPLQFALLCSAVYGNTTEQIVMPGMLEPDGFEHSISILLRCYKYVHVRSRNGEFYKITGTYVIPYAKRVFKQLLHSEKLHPCILLLASRAIYSPGMNSTEILYEVHETVCRQPLVSSEVQEFASFLKIRSEFLDDITSFPFYGYSFEEWEQNTTIRYILSQFTRSFYIEVAEKKISYGFYLL